MGTGQSLQERLANLLSVLGAVIILIHPQVAYTRIDPKKVYNQISRDEPDSVSPELIPALAPTLDKSLKEDRSLC